MRLAIFFLLITGYCVAQNAQPANKAPGFHWSPTEIPNVTMAVVSGDPSAHGPFIVRLHADKAAQIPPHSHGSEERVTVISGSPKLGNGDKFAESALHKVAEGETVTLPKGGRHFAALDAGDEIEISGDGPFGFQWVDPKAVKALNKMKDVQSVSERSKEKAEQDKP
jgi:quercetin dioxygenase-like cupin family protein